MEIFSRKERQGRQGSLKLGSGRLKLETGNLKLGSALIIIALHEFIT